MADDIPRIEYREMAEQSIARSFKGILRVANIVESDSQKGEDVFFNPSYYGQPEGYISDQEVGYASAELALDGQLNRYTFTGDLYKDKKVPVTDSLGYYININVGQGGTTIGSNESNNGNKADIVSFKQIIGEHEFKQPEVFPVVQAPVFAVGLTPKVAPINKAPSAIGGIVNIDSSIDYNSLSAQLIVNNNYDHTAINIVNGKYQHINRPENPHSNTKQRTIYRITNEIPALDDALVHYQDNIDPHNLFDKNEDGSSIDTLDSYVDIVNLKEYVKEKLNKWMGNNTVEVPTGQIIWQYIDLDKWYCLNKESYTGHWPPMNKLQDIGEYDESVYQGVVKKGLNRLAGRSQTELVSEDGIEYDFSPLNEIIPLYKRDYALCDGSTYKIHLLTQASANNNDGISYDMFINLFFALDYQYTKPDVICNHYTNMIERTITVDGKTENVYHWKHDSVNAVTNQESGYYPQNELTDKDVLFGIDLVTMLAFKTLITELKSGGGNLFALGTDSYNREKAEEWLKEQPLPREFIFNTPIPSTDKDVSGMVFEYKSAGTSSDNAKNNRTFKFEIGREVNSFNSFIRYYSHQEKKFVNCRVWQTAEVQAILTFFTYTGALRESALKNYCVYSFQVPNFVQSNDKYTTGVFIGSSPYYWSDEKKTESASYSLSTFSDASLPHRHFIAMGPLSGGLEPSYKSKTASITKNTMTRSEGVHGWLDILPEREVQLANINSYSFAEVSGLKYAAELYNDILTYVIKFTDSSLHTADPRWKYAEPNRGVTSTPVIVNSGFKDLKYESASASNGFGSAEYFTPEAVQMLPLIKL